MSFRNKIKNYPICFILAIFLKALFIFHYFGVDNDKYYQAIAGKNLALGHGITVNQVHSDNLSKTYYEPLVGWPPGYSLLVATCYFIIRDLKSSCLLIDLFAGIFFIVVLRRLLIQLQFPHWLGNLLLLFNGLQLNESIQASAPTDILSVTFCLYSISLVIGLFSQKNQDVGNIKAGVVNVMAAFFRYMYIPVTFVLPVFLLWNGWRKKEKRLVKSGIVTLSITFLLLGGLLLFQNGYTGSPVYLMPARKGFYPANLLQFYPVVFSSFTNLDFLLVQLSIHTASSYTHWLLLLAFINLFVFGILVLALLYACIKRKWVAGNNWQVFEMGPGTMSVILVLLLAGLSARYSRYYLPPTTLVWTYVTDGRYVGLIRFLIPVFFASYLFMHSHSGRSFRNILKVLFLFAVLIDIFHNAYFLQKQFISNRQNPYIAPTIIQAKALLKDVIDENNIKHTDADVVICASRSLINLDLIKENTTLVHPTELNETNIRAQRPTLLIWMTEEQLLPLAKAFISRPDVRFKKFNQYFIYFCFIKPQ
ncbi:MAG: hypothetical protein ACXVPE_16995 [Bacteroidia bacterium]